MVGRHTFYVISFNKATHHFTMPCSIYNRNLYYVLNGCYYGYTTKLTRTNLYQLYLYTQFYMERSNHLGTYNKIHKSSGSIYVTLYTVIIRIDLLHVKACKEVT